MTVIARDDVTLALVTDVASTAHYFQLKASTASAPSAPTAYPAPSPWVTTEPTYTEGATNSLYTVDVTVFSDGSFDYTPVSLSSSYEAAKAAYNKARQAQSSATSAQTAANLALANTQELVINGGFETGDLTGWTASGVAVLSGWDQDYPHSGKYQARFAAGASCSQSINGLVSGHIIRCSFWQRGFDGRTATMTISFNGGTEQTVGSITGVTPYTRVFKDFTVPANTTTATIKLTCDTDFIRFDDISVKDITEAQAAQKAAEGAQATADSANIAAENAASIAHTAQAAAQGAQTTADGKNKIFSSASKPSSKGIVPGDLWFQLDSNQNVNGIQVWNGSTFTDMVLLANELLVASSVGTTQIADNAIVTGKIAANAITAIKIAAQTITGDKLNVGSVASAIMTSNLFKTSGTSDYTIVNDSGVTVYKGGTPYSHLGSDTTYGLQTWNPFSNSMTDVSLMSFGASSIVESNDVITNTVWVAPHTNSWTPWKDFDVIQENGSWKRFRSPSGRFFVALVMGYNGAAADDFAYLCGNINFRENNGGINTSNDYPSTHSIPGGGLSSGVFAPIPFVGLVTVKPNVDYAINFSFKTAHVNIGNNGINAYGHCNYRRLFIMPV